ncbi:hypothetical protein PTSG_11458 [Salpingoeca rosetta]|uniref:Peptidase C19 ubiquitin carboxyl-terminal hydrolase domain-containing protein n=1 Tax=Salpingoeca rosetta (strain ATCC 50818 / BSB-021) TaxID=946362 RepID=F2UTI1_SALR5|nr:uncharacterized protein PTSG_11458 [Salpingoeca rosetta]EGD83703.1 hypothetical protein PTSG_11458 [Salpingoeca rosetta]|eukprot:XP_004987523.1 hypothetical protein PTSG_11458 [Salpingoeca rosetta]
MKQSTNTFSSKTAPTSMPKVCCIIGAGFQNVLSFGGKHHKAEPHQEASSQRGNTTVMFSGTETYLIGPSGSGKTAILRGVVLALEAILNPELCVDETERLLATRNNSYGYIILVLCPQSDASKHIKETLSAEEKNRCLQEERILKDRGFVVLHGERIRVGWAELLKLQNGTLFRLKGNEDFRKRTRNKKGEQQQQLIIATHHVELLNSNTVPIDCLQVRHGSALHRRQPTPATHISTLPRPITEMLGPKIMTKLRDPACLDMYFSRTVVLLEGKTAKFQLIKDLESKRLEHFFRALEFGIQPPENKRAIHNCPSVEDLKQVKTLAKVIADHKLGKKHTPQFILIQFAVLFKAMVHSNSEWKKFKGLGVVQYFKTDEVQAHIDKRFKELMPHVGADITLRHQTYDKLGQHLQQAVEELLTLQFEFSKTQERKDKLRELSRRKDGVNEVKTYLVKNFTNALNTVSVDEIQVKLTELVQQSTQLPLTDPPPSTDELSEMLLVMIWKTYSTQKRKTLQHLLRRELERLQQAHGKLAQDTCLTLNAAKDTLPREQLDALRKSTTPLQPSHLGKLKPSLSRLCKAGWEHGHFVFPPDTADIEGIFINKSTNDDGKAPAPHPECLRSPDCLHGDEREILRKLGENELPRAQAIILNRMKAKISHLSIDVVKGQCESAKKETKLLADFMKTVMSTDEGSAGADGEHDTGGGEHHDDDDDEHHDEHHDDDDDDDDVACIPMSNPSRSRCYMNAVFQCLVRTTPLAQALKDSQDANTNQGALAHQVSNLMGDLTAYSSKDAINVKEKLSFRVGDYTEDKQQDAAEFLGDLLGALCIAPQVADAELCSKCGHTLSVSRSHTVKLSANDPQHPKQQLSLFQALQMQMLPADTVTRSAHNACRT